MAEFSNVTQQTVNPGETVIFTSAPVPCNRGMVRHRDGTGAFLLAGRGRRSCCPCRGNQSVNFLVDFGANIAVPTGGTVGEISLALAMDGATIPASIMSVTPAAVEEFFNVSRAINAAVFMGCCQTLSVRNVSDQPILVEDANIIISRPEREG